MMPSLYTLLPSEKASVLEATAIPKLPFGRLQRLRAATLAAPRVPAYAILPGAGQCCHFTFGPGFIRTRLPPVWAGVPAPGLVGTLGGPQAPALVAIASDNMGFRDVFYEIAVIPEWHPLFGDAAAGRVLAPDGKHDNEALLEAARLRQKQLLVEGLQILKRCPAAEVPSVLEGQLLLGDSGFRTHAHLHIYVPSLPVEPLGARPQRQRRGWGRPRWRPSLVMAPFLDAR